MFFTNSLFAQNNEFLFPLGNLTNTEFKTDSNLNGYVQDTFNNGKIKHIAFYTNDKPYGMVYNYFDHGKIESYGKMINGLKVGLWLEYFYMNGKLKKEVFYSHLNERFSYEIKYHENGQVWHTTINTNDLYTHKEFYLETNGDTQYLHQVVDSIKKIYTYSEFHFQGKPNVIGYKKYSLGKGWEKIGTWSWYTPQGKVIRRKVYSPDPYGI